MLYAATNPPCRRCGAPKCQVHHHRKAALSQPHLPASHSPTAKGCVVHKQRYSGCLVRATPNAANWSVDHYNIHNGTASDDSVDKSDAQTPTSSAASPNHHIHEISVSPCHIADKPLYLSCSQW